MDNSVIIEGIEYNLLKRGRAQAEQLIALGRWINQYGIPAATGMQDDKGEISFNSGTELLTKVLDVLTPDALLALFSLIVGCKSSVSEDNFDVGILIDALTYVYNNNPVVARAIKRFFSGGSSESVTETA